MCEWKLKNTIGMVCVLFLLVINTAYAAPDYIKSLVPAAEKVGEGRLTYLFWDIYDATLYAPQGIWHESKPFALQLSYLRSLEGQKIADRSIEEIRGQGFTDEVRLAIWHTQMRQIFPDVDKGITLTGAYTQGGETVFYKNSDEIGRIKDPRFGKAFFDIWLHEKTSVPELRRQLSNL